MQLATLIVSSMALAVSCATLTVVLVGGGRVTKEMDAFKATAEEKRAQVKAALEGLL